MKQNLKKLLLGFCIVSALGNLSAMTASYSVEKNSSNGNFNVHTNGTAQELKNQQYKDENVTFHLSQNSNSITIAAPDNGQDITLQQLFLQNIDTVSFINSAYIEELGGNVNCWDISANVMLNECSKLPATITVGPETTLTIGDISSIEDMSQTTIFLNGCLNLYGEDLSANQLKEMGFNVISDIGLNLSSNELEIEEYFTDIQNNLFAKLNVLGDGDCAFRSVFATFALQKIINNENADDFLQLVVAKAPVARQHGIALVRDILKHSPLKNTVKKAITPETGTYLKKDSENLTDSDMEQYLKYMAENHTKKETWLVASEQNSLLDALTISLQCNCTIIAGSNIADRKTGSILHQGVFNEGWPMLYFSFTGEHFSPLIPMTDIEVLQEKGIKFNGGIE